MGDLDEIEIYDNIRAEKKDIDLDFDGVIFTSSSCVNNFVEIYGKEPLKNTKIYSIGQITSQTIQFLLFFLEYHRNYLKLLFVL